MTDALADDRDAADLGRPIGAAAFKTRCLRIIDHVSKSGAEVTITKHGRPVAKLVPIHAPAGRTNILGSCKDTLVILDSDDLVPSTADEWADWKATSPASTSATRGR